MDSDLALFSVLSSMKKKARDIFLFYAIFADREASTFQRKDGLPDWRTLLRIRFP